MSPCSLQQPWELTCMGLTAAAGGVFMGLGLRGVRGIVAAAGFGTIKTSTYIMNAIKGFLNWPLFKDSPNL